MKKIGRNDPPNWAETTQGRIDPGRNDSGPKRLGAETTRYRSEHSNNVVIALLCNARAIPYLRHFRGFKGQTSSACGQILPAGLPAFLAHQMRQWDNWPESEQKI